MARHQSKAALAFGSGGWDNELVDGCEVAAGTGGTGPDSSAAGARGIVAMPSAVSNIAAEVMGFIDMKENLFWMSIKGVIVLIM